jgi:hypothetical protein
MMMMHEGETEAVALRRVTYRSVRTKIGRVVPIGQNRAREDFSRSSLA